jgi:hypothetical protein
MSFRDDARKGRQMEARYTLTMKLKERDRRSSAIWKVGSRLKSGITGLGGNEIVNQNFRGKDLN